PEVGAVGVGEQHDAVIACRDDPPVGTTPVGAPGTPPPAVTVKLDGEVPVRPPTATVIVPVVAPVGTVVTIWVAVELVTTAVVPLNMTTLLAGVVLKLVPVMVTVVPTGPWEGVKLAIVGAAAAVTVKLIGEVPVRIPTVTVIVPVVAPVGTIVTIWVEVELVTIAFCPLNLTMLSAAVVLNLVPVMVTTVPIGP
ncbi:MAG TPA: hypothetical protein VK187_05510, partial [Geobacteraceae bacterium]|nr:hypothetical protein [Geobacteraceae bacterium]